MGETRRVRLPEPIKRSWVKTTTGTPPLLRSIRHGDSTANSQLQSDPYGGYLQLLPSPNYPILLAVLDGTRVAIAIARGSAC